MYQIFLRNVVRQAFYVFVNVLLGYYLSIILNKYKEFFIIKFKSSFFSKTLALHAVKYLIKSPNYGLYVQMRIYGYFKSIEV